MPEVSLEELHGLALDGDLLAMRELGVAYGPMNRQWRRVGLSKRSAEETGGLLTSCQPSRAPQKSLNDGSEFPLILLNVAPTVVI